MKTLIESSRRASKPSRGIFSLICLSEGETLAHKAAELALQGKRTATIDEIEICIGDGKAYERDAPIVIADPQAVPTTYLGDTPYPIVMVPACAIEKPGKPPVRGMIDLHVPMHPVKDGGQLAILLVKT